MIDFNSTLISIDKPTDADISRKAIIANGYSIIDLSASDPIKKKKFEELLGPIAGKWDLARPYTCKNVDGKYVTTGVSTCGLVARGLWHRMSIDYPALYSNYVPGSAISGEISFAKKNKAWQTYVPNSEIKPTPGDYIIIGSGLSTHALTALEWADESLISVDGGQVDNKGLQCIKKRQRKWIIKNNEAYLDDKKVLGWIIFDLLLTRNSTVIVPEDWNE